MSPAASRPKPRVLVVDDVAADRAYLSRMLRGAGCEVRTAEDALGAIDLVEEWSPHIVLLDVVMEPLSGFEACRRIHALAPLLPIVMCSIKDRATDRAWAKQQGASGYLVKPVDETKLLDKLGRLLRPRT